MMMLMMMMMMMMMMMIMIMLQDLHRARVVLGLCPMEQEVIDMTNEVARDGLIFFPEFCRIVLRKFREEDEEQFAQVMFKVSDPLPRSK